MKYAKIGQLRDRLSSYISQVRDGDEVVVLDRERPVARIIRAGGAPGIPGGEDARLAALERRGLLRRGRGRFPAVLRRARPVKVRGSILADLMAEREAGW
jgi:antitoxin (DNA-binding transcriptional repressor) of toxin-antitoxin stability system